MKDDFKIAMPTDEIIKISKEIVEREQKAKRNQTIKLWLADKVVDIAALVISIIALIRTF